MIKLAPLLEIRIQTVTPEMVLKLYDELEDRVIDSLDKHYNMLVYNLLHSYHEYFKWFVPGDYIEQWPKWLEKLPEDQLQLFYKKLLKLKASIKPNRLEEIKIDTSLPYEFISTYTTYECEPNIDYSNVYDYFKPNKEWTNSNEDTKEKHEWYHYVKALVKQWLDKNPLDINYQRRLSDEEHKKLNMSLYSYLNKRIDRNLKEDTQTLPQVSHPKSKLSLFKTIALEILEWINSVEFRHSGYTYDQVRDHFCKKYNVNPKEYQEWNNNREELSESLKEIKITPDITSLNQIKIGDEYDFKSDNSEEWYKNYILKYISNNYYTFDSKQWGVGAQIALSLLDMKELIKKREIRWAEEGVERHDQALDEIKIEPVSFSTTWSLFLRIYNGGLRVTALRTLRDHGFDIQKRKVSEVKDWMKELNTQKMISFYDALKAELQRLKDFEEYQGFPHQIN